MHRQDLLDIIQLYQDSWGQNQVLSGRVQQRDFEISKNFLDFVKSADNCFDRTNVPGHITGSALIVNQDLTQVLLTHHKKLDIWLQLGGHADGNHDVVDVAMTEAHEESGLQDLSLLKYEEAIFPHLRPLNGVIPFDLDTHVIPKTATSPEHWHFDVRFLIVSDSRCLPLISDESHDVRWFTFNEARNVTQEDSMERQFKKTEAIRKHLV
jgi:8-oxo-dGTP pyrophosphatase MutT (NUDIX family)